MKDFKKLKDLGTEVVKGEVSHKTKSGICEEIDEIITEIKKLRFFIFVTLVPALALGSALGVLLAKLIIK
jgi:hypothetical protein